MIGEVIMKRVWAFSLSLILSFCFLTGCEEVIDFDKSTTVLTDGFQGVFNPLFADSKGDIAVCDLLFDSIVEISESGDVIAGLADFEVLENGCKYRFKLRNAEFSDGTRIKTSDVLFTLKVVADDSYEGNIDLSDLGILGFDNYTNGDSSEITGFETSEDGGFNIVLEEANPDFLERFTFGILSEEYYGKEYEQGDVSSVETLNAAPLGSGQYIFESFNGNIVKVKANKNYFKGQPQIDEIILKSVDNKTELSSFDLIETDFASEILKGIPKRSNYKVKNYACNVFYNFGFNCKDTLFSDEDIRYAIALAVNLENLSKRICGSKDGVPEIFDKVYAVERDIEKAAEILKDNGYKKNSDGFFSKGSEVLEFTLSYEKGKTIEETLAKQLETDLREFGVKVNLKEVENLADKIKNGKEQSFIICTEDGGKYFGAISFKTKTFENVYNFSSDEFDGLLDDYKKNALTDGMKKIVAEEVPCLPIYMKLQTVISSDDMPKIYSSAYRSLMKNMYSVELNQ